ncbi:MAG: phage holin family protein [Candidatus Cloacimonetes bacterium]|nr:phage holin family protein [Candidatus Cloacimonadota bacterium]
MRRFVANFLMLTVIIYTLGTETGLFTLDGWWSAIVGAVLLSLFNQIIRPFIVAITMPLSCLAFGIIMLIINACLLMLAAWFVPNFETYEPWRIIMAALIISFVATIVNRLICQERRCPKRIIA